MRGQKLMLARVSVRRSQGAVWRCVHRRRAHLIGGAQGCGGFGARRKRDPAPAAIGVAASASRIETIAPKSTGV
jgi:hypothetical protein